jgi:hypothetical protein
MVFQTPLSVAFFAQSNLGALCLLCMFHCLFHLSAQRKKLWKMKLILQNEWIGQNCVPKCPEAKLLIDRNYIKKTIRSYGMEKGTKLARGECFFE